MNAYCFPKPGRRHLAMLAALFLAAGCRTMPPATGPNLEWDGPKVYSTGSVAVNVAGFGINGIVDQLPARAPFSMSVTRVIKNTGDAPVAAGYEINETVHLLRLASVAGGVRFVAAPVPPVANLTLRGPALAPGDSAVISFGIPLASCGIYRETLSIDVNGIVPETNEVDNTALHHFAVAGSMRVNISVVPNNPLMLWHAPAGIGSAPNWAAVAPVFPVDTHAFTITAATPGTTFHYGYYQKPVKGAFGTTAQLVGALPVMPPVPPVAGPVTVTHRVNPLTHNVAPNDILLDAGIEHFLPRVTAVTGDGCSVRQLTAQVGVAHN